MSEGVPKDNTDNIFYAIADQLDTYTEDPYIQTINQEAKKIQDELNVENYADTVEKRRKLTRYLDEKWRYHDKNIKVTGEVWLRLPDNDHFTRRMCIDETVVSRGFAFFIDNTDEDHAKVNACHMFNLDIGGGNVTSAILCIDDIIRLEAIDPSYEAKILRFSYYHPNEASWLCELAETSPRDDQIIKSFGEFDMDIDFNDQTSVETLYNANAYIEYKAKLENKANYRLQLMGKVIYINEHGDGIVKGVDSPFNCFARINTILLRPKDATAVKLEGVTACTPYVDITIFDSDGYDVDMLVPCVSISKIRSVRYNTDI